MVAALGVGVYSYYCSYKEVVLCLSMDSACFVPHQVRSEAGTGGQRLCHPLHRKGFVSVYLFSVSANLFLLKLCMRLQSHVSPRNEGECCPGHPENRH